MTLGVLLQIYKCDNKLGMQHQKQVTKMVSQRKNDGR